MIDSYKNLLPDSGSNTVTLLTQISQQISNGSQIPAQASLPPFRPPTSAVWVNALWFLSLVISLFCALLATLQQYWARRYLRRTYPQCAIHKRSRIRSFFAEGVDRFYLPFAVETIPALLHISMFLFLTGLVISLFSIHHAIAHVILAATVVCGFVYMVITVMPVFYHNSPYQSPLSALAWAISRKMAKISLSAVHYVVSLQKHTGFIQADSIASLTKRILDCKKRLSLSMAKAAEAAADRQHWSIDARALSWTLDQSDEESEVEKFVAGLARFVRSRKVDDPMGMLKEAITGSTLHHSLYREVTTLLINATRPGLLANYKKLPDSVRMRRVVICLEALHFIPQAIEKLLRRVAENLNDKKVRRGLAPVFESELSWRTALVFSNKWEQHRSQNKKFETVILSARCLATVIATRLPDGMSRSILTEQFGISTTDQDVLDRYQGSSANFLLKNLNHFLINTALNFIHVKDTDILVSTVRIIKQHVQLNSAAPELRVEFEQLFRTIVNLVRELKVSETVRKNAMGLLKELASLRNSASGDGSPPTPTTHNDSTTTNSGNIAMVSPIQFPLPRVSSPPPGDVYISMLPNPSTPSGETHPLMPIPSRAYPEPPDSATLPAMTRDTASGDENRLSSS